MAGAFVWHELMTTDTAAATAFYTSVVGWRARDSGMPGMDYTLMMAGEAHAAGLMRQPAEAAAMGAPPGWIGHVEVDDVDASAAQAASLGGTVHAPGRDIPGVGRFAVIADPQGAVLCLFRGTSAAGVPPMEPGRVSWNELMASDMPAVWPFYETMFGWTKAEALDMGPMGTYQLYATGGTTIGGMMTRPPAVPVSFWLYYIAVPHIDAAIVRVTECGGMVLNGPMEVPGGAWVVQGKDPQGAMFALVGARAAG